MATKQSEHDRISEAYMRMADEAKHRPAGDRRGGRDRLEQEARAYADRFVNEIDGGSFDIGVPDYRTNRAFVYTIEAARLLCAVQNERTLQLLKMAAREIESGGKRQ